MTVAGITGNARRRFPSYDADLLRAHAARRHLNLALFIFFSLGVVGKCEQQVSLFAC